MARRRSTGLTRKEWLETGAQAVLAMIASAAPHPNGAGAMTRLSPEERTALARKMNVTRWARVRRDRENGG